MHSRLAPFIVMRDVFLYSLTMAAVVWLISLGGEQLGYSWHWRQMPRYFFTIIDHKFTPGPLVKGLAVTLEITAVSLVFAGIIGLMTALLRLSTSTVGRWLARGYLELIRNTPLLV